MKSLNLYVREVKDHEVPIEARQGRTGGFIGYFAKKKKEVIPEKDPIILFNKNLRFLALANYEKSEVFEKKVKVKYIVKINYNESALNPTLSAKDYFMSIMYDFFLTE